MANTITAHVSSWSIYNSTISEVQLRGKYPFRAKISGDILSIQKGYLHRKNIISVEKDGEHQVNINICGAMHENIIKLSDKMISDTGYSPHETYGMRFYPFVSSRLELDISIDGGTLGLVLIELPLEYRAIWYLVKVTYGEDISKFEHYIDKQKSMYIFNKNGAINHKDVKISMDIRFSTERLLSLINFPAIYLLIALCGISLASFSGDNKISIASILATWTFMLKKWNASELPQQNTLLTFFYIATGASLPIWWLLWKFAKLWAFPSFIIVFLAMYAVHKSVKTFSHTGSLPEIITKYWCKYVYKANNAQMSSATNLK